VVLFLSHRRPVDAGDSLRDRHAASYAVRGFRAWLKGVRKARPASVNLSLAALDHFYRFLGLDPPLFRASSRDVSVQLVRGGRRTGLRPLHIPSLRQGDI